METKPQKIDSVYPYIDRDEYSGVVQKMEKIDGKNYIRTISADIEANTDWNKARQNDGSNGYSPSRDFQHVASIPLHVVELWKKVYGIDVFNKDHEKAVIRLLNDSELRHFRTNNGKPI
jgi:hypothetical protein